MTYIQIMMDLIPDPLFLLSPHTVYRCTEQHYAMDTKRIRDRKRARQKKMCISTSVCKDQSGVSFFFSPSMDMCVCVRRLCVCGKFPRVHCGLFVNQTKTQKSLAMR